MKTLTLTIFLFTLIVCSICVPIDSVDEPDVLPEEPERENKHQVSVDDSHLRVKRFTCDVLSFEAVGVKLNDAACALHCVKIGKRGGWCDGHKVCNCRK
ncbi:tenecin-1 isoform X1 [Diorhabda sublineata]|uniref:tenecin-1 isoform X1 n=1 Tax=Diorhabda sublineata TaxID=1163346 RepID=UPI0024E10729|nr:tenecin-1 isoform X1 [Diorhabda sublineata]